jgi:hypothetical protein
LKMRQPRRQDDDFEKSQDHRDFIITHFDESSQEGRGVGPECHQDKASLGVFAQLKGVTGVDQSLSGPILSLQAIC